MRTERKTSSFRFVHSNFHRPIISCGLRLGCRHTDTAAIPIRPSNNGTEEKTFDEQTIRKWLMTRNFFNSHTICWRRWSSRQTCGKFLPFFMISTFQRWKINAYDHDKERWRGRFGACERNNKGIIVFPCSFGSFNWSVGWLCGSYTAVRMKYVFGKKSFRFAVCSLLTFYEYPIFISHSHESMVCFVGKKRYSPVAAAWSARVVRPMFAFSFICFFCLDLYSHFGLIPTVRHYHEPILIFIKKKKKQNKYAKNNAKYFTL